MTRAQYERRQRVMELGDRFMSYLDAGAGAGPPVVLLHGMPTWGYVWHRVVPELAARRRVLVPDLLGYGHSDKSDRFDRSIAKQAEAVDLWLQHLGVTEAIIVGHDVGGGVALRLAVFFRMRVGRLGLMNPVCYDSWPYELMLELGDPSLKRRGAAGTERMLRALVHRQFAQDPGDDLERALVAPYASELGKVSLIRNAAALNPNQTIELSPLLARLALPATVLWGDDDRLQSFRYGQRLGWDLPGARLLRVPGARHLAMLEQPLAVAEAIEALGVAPAPQPRAGV